MALTSPASPDPNTPRPVHDGTTVMSGSNLPSPVPTPILKPKRLGPGSLFAIVSPASAARPELVTAGQAALEARGYRTRLMPHALDRGPLYYAGSASERLADLHAAFADPTVDAIISTRGGYGCAELLPHLDYDLIRRNPKPLLGYSDQTSLHLALRNACGLVTFQAPMVAADFSKPNGIDAPSFASALEQTAPWSVGPEQGLRLLRPPTGTPLTSPTGELHGGCLALYAEALGTPFAPVPRGGVLFLEDIGVKPYQWDRLLTHCRLAGCFAGVTAIVFGDMRQACTPAEQPLLEPALLHALADFEGPLLIGLRSGHVDASNVTLPFGVQVALDLNDDANPRMHFLESAVTG